MLVPLRYIRIDRDFSKIRTYRFQSADQKTKENAKSYLPAVRSEILDEPLHQPRIVCFA